MISLGGKILFPNGTPVRGAEVEIWQVDANGIYQKMATNGDAKMDPNFQGYGRFETASNGEYRFRTIQPVPYRGRSAPHIHFKIRTKSHQPWTTQLFIAGHPGNARDFLYRKIGDEAARQRVSADFSSSKVSFDIVLGWTPQD
ncbi:MAG: hypothetical protein NTW74_13390 [Acidobacteria bacterium]|nr:hypothetical protein [Acidobacteriota bacterium]